ncbi:hypothetical protein K2173_025334 [Erythroxylum novogranatense]|uniref:ATP-dependent RNA helicase n=1 Tax=Erythroxylum novogranatense TaxID=1862640 RepID=A0AAV8UGY5_9ROSI|nr:hypothetical protein K2173_025334 [Erythroxylum novogranatense]
MRIKLLPQLHFLNPSFSVTRLRPMKLGASINSSGDIHVLSRIFPFRLKYHANQQPAVRRFSTRSFRPRPGSTSEFGRRGSEMNEGRASKSLVEDEAELSDWVSGLNNKSFRGRLGSEDESDSGMVRNRGKKSIDREMNSGMVRNRGKKDIDREMNKGRVRERVREGFTAKRRRESGEFGDSKTRIRSKVDSFSRRSRGSQRFDSACGENDDEEEEEEGERYNSRRNSGRDLNLKSGKRGHRGIENSRVGRSVGSGLRAKRGFMDEEESDVDNDDDDDDDEEGKTSMRGFGDLLSEDESDDGDNDIEADRVLKENGKSSLGLSVKRPSSPGDSQSSYLSETRFDQCAISPLSLKGVKDAGYEKMTVVQEATLPVILKGKDVLAKAKTGTGKTVAFLLPSIEVIVKCPPVDRDQKRPPIIVLVICPTRELASQAAAEANTLLKYHPSFGVQVVMGGTRLALEQKRMQANPCQILVATPGRLRDHMENTAGFATRLMGVKVLILDEADHLLDMGFRKDIEKIIAAVPKQRQTLLFSATVPEEVRQICHIALKRDHEFINTVQEGSEETHSQVQQTFLVAPLDKQFPLLYTLLKDHIADDVNYKVLVFCTTAMVTRMVADLLGELKLNVREIHSRKPQSYRTRVSDEFRKSKGLILVTSDVSARGVDYPDVTLVIQLGLPADREQYIHRLGRTGRRGKEGQGVLLLAPWEEFFLSTIRDLPVSKAAVPSVDPETKKKVERALSHVEMKNKEAAYQAWLGYYNSNKNVGRDKYRLVELASEFSRSMGLDNPPAIPKLVVAKMGLRNIPGLRSK